MPDSSRLELIAKYAAIISALVAATVGIANFAVASWGLQSRFSLEYIDEYSVAESEQFFESLDA